MQLFLILQRSNTLTAVESIHLEFPLWISPDDIEMMYLNRKALILILLFLQNPIILLKETAPGLVLNGGDQCIVLDNEEAPAKEDEDGKGEEIEFLETCEHWSEKIREEDNEQEMEIEEGATTRAEVEIEKEREERVVIVVGDEEVLEEVEKEKEHAEKEEIIELDAD